MEANAKAATKVQAARTALVLDEPFFGVLALRLRLQEDDSFPTAWTDGRTLGYNPTWVENMPAVELKGVIAHEVMHCAAGHPWRRDAREQHRWNAACDYAINGVLLSTGFKLPGECLYEAQWNGKSAEFIYNNLPKDDDKHGSCQCLKDAPRGEGEDPDPTATEVDWQQAVQQAANMAQAQGRLPGELRQFATEAVQPRVDWRSALRRFVQQAAASDYSYTRPSRRFLAHGLYLPALYSQDLGPIAVAVDTSGSVCHVLNVFAAEIQSIADEAAPARIHVIYCDAKVQGVDTFERGEPVRFEARGGGGTDFRPAFEALAEFEESPVCFIYLTDLEGSFPESCEVPTLWVATTRHRAPFGETLYIGDGV